MVIFYADDDPDDHEVFTEIIQTISRDIQIHRAEDGRHTLEVLSLHTPDIIFLDVNMPFLNGFQALAEIRKNEKLKDVEVIMYSTNMHTQLFDQYAHLNVSYLRKPNTIKEGVEAIRIIIERRGSEGSVNTT